MNDITIESLIIFLDNEAKSNEEIKHDTGCMQRAKIDRAIIAYLNEFKAIKEKR